MSFLYHRVPRFGQEGDILYPLNQLKDIYPSAYEKQKAKYNSRLGEMKIMIPQLNCAWNDVLHFSAVHPLVIKQELEKRGDEFPAGISFYEIDPYLLDPNKTIVFLFTKPKPLFIEESEIIPYRPEDIAHYAHITDLTRQHYQDLIAQKKKPLLYFGVPHILYRGTLDTEQLKTITI